MSAPTAEERQTALKALSHPLRVLILSKVEKETRSPGDIAVELGSPLGVVSYHIRMLRDYGAVELKRTEPRRGALQHFYRSTPVGRRLLAMKAAVDAPILSDLRAVRQSVEDDPAAALRRLDGVIEKLEAAACAG